MHIQRSIAKAKGKQQKFVISVTMAIFIRELSFFSSRGGGGGGGCGRNGMKDSVKFLIPPWKKQKNC